MLIAPVHSRNFCDCRLAFLSRLSPWRGLTIFFGLPIIPWGCHGSSGACEVLIACIQRGIVSFVETWRNHGWRHERSADGPRHIRREEGGGSLAPCATSCQSSPSTARFPRSGCHTGMCGRNATCASAPPGWFFCKKHVEPAAMSRLLAVFGLDADPTPPPHPGHQPGSSPDAPAACPRTKLGLPDPDPSEHGEFNRILRHRALCSSGLSRGCCFFACRTSSW